MKRFIFLYFVFNVLFFSAQTKNGGSGNPPAVENMVTTLMHDTCLNKKFSIVFYVVLDSNYSPQIATPANLNTLVNNLNKAFKPICVQFLNCSTVYIPNYTYNQWSKNIIDPIVTANWYTDKTINFYIVENVTNLPTNELLGYAYPPPATPTSTPKDVIVIKNTALLSGNIALFQSDVPVHHMGHFFGLPNTFDEINPATPAVPGPPPGVISNEYFNRTNCYLHGDGFCDTEADCYPVSLGPPCGHNTGIFDGNNEYYVPPVDNLMSNYGCRCRFSQEQYNYMAYIILTKRFYLH